MIMDKLDFSQETISSQPNYVITYANDLLNDCFLRDLCGILDNYEVWYDSFYAVLG